MKDVRTGNVSLDNLILVLLSVLELTPHVLRVDAELPRSLYQTNPGSSRTRRRFDDPQRLLVIPRIIAIIEPVKAKDESQQSVVHSLIIDYQILRPIVIEVGEGSKDESVVEMFTRIQCDCLIGLLFLEIADKAHLSSADLEIYT